MAFFLRMDFVNTILKGVQRKNNKCQPFKKPFTFIIFLTHSAVLLINIFLNNF
jgi:hypothetical protein